LEGGKVPGFDPNFSSGISRPLLALRLRSRLALSLAGGLRSRLALRDRLLLYDRGILYLFCQSDISGFFGKIGLESLKDRRRMRWKSL